MWPLVLGEVVVSCAVVVISSLAFVSAWDARRMRAMHREVEALEAEEKVDKDVIVVPKDAPVEPFLEVHLGTSCPKCSVRTQVEPSARGISVLPTTCVGNARYRCSVKRSHLHARCISCDCRWVMATADRPRGRIGGAGVDEDVRLSVQHAHEKWVAEVAIFGAVAAMVTIAFCVHDCNMKDRPCVDTTFDPAYYKSIVCPDHRQRLSTPPGWTWVKCSCPER